MSNSSYGWIITKDWFSPVKEEGVYSGPGVMGPGNMSDEMEKDLKAGKGKAFKMYDDDNEIYYSGRYIGDDSEDMFGPLDDYGTPNSGAVHIKYKAPGKNGKWEYL